MWVSIEPCAVGPAFDTTTWTTPFSLDDRRDAIEVVEAREVSPHDRGVLADPRGRLFQLRLPTPRDEDVGALLHEPLGRRQADPATRRR